MDLLLTHTLVSILSASMQMLATIIMLFYVVTFFSFKAGSSLKSVFFALLYFFSSAVFLYVSSVWLSVISRPGHLLAGVSALIQVLLIHITYGLIISALYLRTFLSAIKR